MKCELSEQAYQWQNDDGSYGVGKLVMAVGGNRLMPIDRFNGVIVDITDEPLDEHNTVLIAHSYTSDLEFVPFGKLSDYPSSAIPEPTK